MKVSGMHLPLIFNNSPSSLNFVVHGIDLNFDRLKLFHFRENPQQLIADHLHLSSNLSTVGDQFLNIGVHLGPLSSELVCNADINFHYKRLLIDLAHLRIRLDLDDEDSEREVLELLLAFSHMIPFLELTKFIAQKGHKVSFVSTPRNIDRLPKLPPTQASLINFVKLPLPPMPNLPENAEATIDLPYDDVKYLKKAHNGLREAMAMFLQESRSDRVLFDFDAYWVPEVASEFGVSTAFSVSASLLSWASLGLDRQMLSMRRRQRQRNSPFGQNGCGLKRRSVDPHWWCTVVGDAGGSAIRAGGTSRWALCNWEKYG
nr:UDP-glycosyltransferase 91A1-like [Ipomoea batatas]